MVPGMFEDMGRTSAVYSEFIANINDQLNGMVKLPQTTPEYAIYIVDKVYASASVKQFHGWIEMLKWCEHLRAVNHDSECSMNRLLSINLRVAMGAMELIDTYDAPVALNTFDCRECFAQYELAGCSVRNIMKLFRLQLMFIIAKTDTACQWIQHKIELRRVGEAHLSEWMEYSTKAHSCSSIDMVRAIVDSAPVIQPYIFSTTLNVMPN